MEFPFEIAFTKVETGGKPVHARRYWSKTLYLMWLVFLITTLHFNLGSSRSGKGKDGTVI